MEVKIKNDKFSKTFVRTKIKSTHLVGTSPDSIFMSTVEDHHSIGHSRNSRKAYYSTGSRG